MKVQKITVVLGLLIGLASALSLPSHQSTADFCWRDSYGRGVGVIPSVCPPEREKIGLLCYTKCPAEFYRYGFDCHQLCPKDTDWSDNGLYCRLNEYGRGAGYPWKFGDWFNDNGMIARCEADNGRGNCEKWGLMYYPKCKPSFYPFGCCICRPSLPDCLALGYNGNFDIACYKKIIIGDPISMDCINGQVYDAGLCYNPCDNGFDGVGPVCWKIPPADWVNCGMGAAKDSNTCRTAIFDQLSSVGNLALNIATFGTGRAAKLAKDATKAAKLKKDFNKLKNAANSNKRLTDAVLATQGKFPPVEAGKSMGEILKADQNSVTLEDIVRVSAQIAALADPSGISDVVSAYTYPKCSKITA